MDMDMVGRAMQILALLLAIVGLIGQYVFVLPAVILDFIVGAKLMTGGFSSPDETFVLIAMGAINALVCIVISRDMRNPVCSFDHAALASENHARKLIGLHSVDTPCRSIRSEQLSTPNKPHTDD